jgi:hypothetical protein
MAFLFVFQTAYLRYHLLTERHQDGLPASAQERPFDFDEHGDGDHHDGHHHRPHAASDHTLPVIIKHQTPLLMLDLVASETSVALTPPDAQVFRVFYEREELPGESPPDPKQPRAPPVA